MSQKQHVDSSPLFDVQKCAVCGCTDDCACPGGCYWVADNLCSRCSDAPIEVLCSDCMISAVAGVQCYCEHCCEKNCDGTCGYGNEMQDAPCKDWECAHKEQCMSALLAGFQWHNDVMFGKMADDVAKEVTADD